MTQYAEIYGEKLDVLKKGSQYFNISLEKIIFKDILNFSSPCSLDKYLKQWYDGDVGKSIFPYQAFDSIEKIRSCKQFPAYEKFYSDLKQKNVDLQEYEAAKMEFNRRRNLDPTDPDYIADFSGEFTFLLFTFLLIYV